MSDALVTLPPSALAVLDRLRATAAQIGAIVGVEPFATPEREQTAAQLLRAISTLDKEADDERTRAKAPHLAAGRAVDDAFKPARAELDRVAGLIRSRLAEAAQARERERAAALAAVAVAVKAGDHVQANASLALAADPVFQPVAGPGISERFTWEPVAFEIAAMPREYLTVDMGKVRAEIAEANRLGRVPSVPGITFERKATIIARRF